MNPLKFSDGLIKQRARAGVELEGIREALLGFAMINGYLPCSLLELALVLMIIGVTVLIVISALY